MFASIAGVALAFQLGGPAYALNESNPPIQEIQYHRYGRPPPCGHGYVSIAGTAYATRTGWCRRNSNRAGIILWSTAAVDGPSHAAMAPTSIFAMSSVIRQAQCRGAFSRVAKAITTVETATTRCGSIDRSTSEMFYGVFERSGYRFA